MYSVHLLKSIMAKARVSACLNPCLKAGVNHGFYSLALALIQLQPPIKNLNKHHGSSRVSDSLNPSLKAGVKHGFCSLALASNQLQPPIKNLDKRDS